jgi:hypothetical protein
LRPNGGHSPYFAFGDDTYRHGRTTRTDPHRPARTLTDLTDLTDTHGHSRTLTDTHGHSRHSRTLTDSHGLSRTLTDSHGLSRILTNSRGVTIYDPGVVYYTLAGKGLTRCIIDRRDAPAIWLLLRVRRRSLLHRRPPQVGFGLTKFLPRILHEERGGWHTVRQDRCKGR